MNRYCSCKTSEDCLCNPGFKKIWEVILGGGWWGTFYSEDKAVEHAKYHIYSNCPAVIVQVKFR